MSGRPIAPGTVRVRFAPSPTGDLHVGGARTAIFNWLFARHHGGAFVLRIEDTDVERSTIASEAALVADLRWLRLDWQEGPDVGGPHGPYRQSERLERYARIARELVERGLAYPCFCSGELLEAKRGEAARTGNPPRYDGTCRHLSPEKIEELRSLKTPEAIRFKVPEEMVSFQDLIRGPIRFDADTVGDFVVLRSNARPTYNFAAAVDDRAMRITHVLRGEEHLPNTLRQILLFRALGASLPEFGHLPLIMAEDRSKLSKRHGAASVGELREMGLLPEAVVNYLVLLGWSHPEGREILGVDELVERFTLERVSKSAAVYDKRKLFWMNGQYIRKTPVRDLFTAADAFFPHEVGSSYPKEERVAILRLLQESVERLGDLPKMSAPFLPIPEMEDEALAVLRSPGTSGILEALARILERSPRQFSGEEFKGWMKEVGKTTGKTGKDLFFPVRAALTGALHGPDLGGVASLRGRDQVLGLLERALSMAEK